MLLNLPHFCFCLFISQIHLDWAALEQKCGSSWIVQFMCNRNVMGMVKPTAQKQSEIDLTLSIKGLWLEVW